MKRTQIISLIAFCGFGAVAGIAQTVGGGTCNSSSLNGTYAVTLNGRQVASTGFTKVLQSLGSVTFDGQSKATFNTTVNTNQTFGTASTVSATYTVQANCSGTLTAGPATYTISIYNQGKNFVLSGQDGTYALAGGGSTPPSMCTTSSLSGSYAVNGNGFSLTGAVITGVIDVTGLATFDGAGNLTVVATLSSAAVSLPTNSTGTYTISASCQGTATVTDVSGAVSKVNFSISNAAAADFNLIASNVGSIYSGAGHVTFVNPGQAVVNAASNIAAQTPAGSLFSIYGSGLAAKQGQAGAVPLPTTIGSTSVTVNGELAPLFYVDANQINAQMPEDIKPGLATVVVKNGTTVSNAVAVTVPDTGTPGIFVYGNNRAVVMNADQVTVNSAANPAKVGDVLVAYFTGGGAVSSGAPLVTGNVSPGGLSPVTGAKSATVAGNDASVTYMGLTPGSIGLYQVNFMVPKVANGDHPLAITIAGKTSNKPLIAVVN